MLVCDRRARPRRWAPVAGHDDDALSPVAHAGRPPRRAKARAKAAQSSSVVVQPTLTRREWLGSTPIASRTGEGSTPPRSRRSPSARRLRRGRGRSAPAPPRRRGRPGRRVGKPIARLGRPDHLDALDRRGCVQDGGDLSAGGGRLRLRRAAVVASAAAAAPKASSAGIGSARRAGRAPARRRPAAVRTGWPAGRPARRRPGTHRACAR